MKWHGGLQKLSIITQHVCKRWHYLQSWSHACHIQPGPPPVGSHRTGPWRLPAAWCHSPRPPRPPPSPAWHTWSPQRSAETPRQVWNLTTRHCTLIFIGTCSPVCSTTLHTFPSSLIITLTPDGVLKMSLHFKSDALFYTTLCLLHLAPKCLFLSIEIWDEGKIWSSVSNEVRS